MSTGGDPSHNDLAIMYVRIAVNIPAVSGEFDYSLPPELDGQVQAGSLVTVPFGNQVVQGVVTQLLAEPSVAQVRAAISLLDALPVLTPAQIELARWMSGYYLQPLAAFIGLMLPAGLNRQADVLYTLADHRRDAADNSQLSTVHRRLLDLLKRRGALRGRQIDRHFSRVDWRKAMQTLVRRGLVTSRPVLPPPTVRPKFVRTAQLAIPPEQAQAAMPTLGKTAETLKRRAAALQCLMRQPEALNVAWVYAESGCNLADLQELAERDLIVLQETEIWRDPLQRIENDWPENQVLTLTPEQEAAMGQILQAFDSKPSLSLEPFLLHGVTGSGKTEIYIRAAEEAVRRGRQALILVPEIALTPQTVRRFLTRFPGQVGLVHSKLSDGERYDTWRRARTGLLKVVIGPRSALFSPLPDVGLIVLDECHDNSYYQSEPPFYHAVTAARQYSRLCGAVCVLGSATPPVAYRYQAERGMSRLLELPERIRSGSETTSDAGLPPVHIVDMREELKAGNRAIFSRRLHEALTATLARGEQAILFLNRRGSATYVFCRECGYVLKCPQCETPLTQHVEHLESSKVGNLGNDQSTLQPSNLQTLNCHRCGYQRQMPKKCPLCGGTKIRAYGLGSEKVEREVQTLFPSARTLRWDWETTRQKDAHEIILSHFVAGRADVLVGTQMLAKGLDLPKVTLVGMVLADVGLNLPDPFAAERTFQVLTQVAGRAGRSALGGQAILQTFQPEHYAIQAAAGHDYASFYRQELGYRQALGYPPFARLVRLEFRHADAARAEQEADRLAARLNAEIAAEKRVETDVIGPVPCFFAKVGGVYRWQVILRGPQPESLLQNKNLADWRIEVDPVSLL